MNATPTRKTVSQACDACRRRKIKCNGLQPCPGCASAGLSCTFKVPQRKGGNQGVRATVLNELRGSQGRELNSTIETTSPVGSQASPISQSGTETIGLETITIEACIKAYLDRIHPVVPFLTPEILQNETLHTSDSLLSRQFIVSFCAYVVTFGKVLDESLLFTSRTSEHELGTQLLNAALRMHVPGRLITPNVQSVFISFFLYGAYAGLGQYRQGWFYLREATTLFMLLKDEKDEPWYSESIQQRLYWILLISERAHGIRKCRPITLQAAHEISIPEDSTGNGLIYLAAIFRPFDEVFFAVWNGSRQDCSKEWLLGLERDVRSALPKELNISTEQAANLRISQLWLQIKLWELFPRFGFLSSESVFECLTFKYPVMLARDLTILALKMPISSLQVHGIGMTEKIFDIACALADVLHFVSTSTSQFELGPVDYLVQITSLLAKLPGGSSKFVPLLLTKVTEMHPELVKVLCDASERPIAALQDPMSPDSKFMYDEEVTTSLYSNLRRGR